MADVTAHAGEKAQKTGDFSCARCNEKVHVKQGEKIPRCPNGHTGFESRRHEPDAKS
jgi:DNA-directed RNA polymerase subunit RPC12/RpoP